MNKCKGSKLPFYQPERKSDRKGVAKSNLILPRLLQHTLSSFSDHAFPLNFLPLLLRSLSSKFGTSSPYAHFQHTSSPICHGLIFYSTLFALAMAILRDQPIFETNLFFAKVYAHDITWQIPKWKVDGGFPITARSPPRAVLPPPSTVSSSDVAKPLPSLAIAQLPPFLASSKGERVLHRNKQRFGLRSLCLLSRALIHTHVFNNNLVWPFAFALGATEPAECCDI